MLRNLSSTPSQHQMENSKHIFPCQVTFLEKKEFLFQPLHKVTCSGTLEMKKMSAQATEAQAIYISLKHVTNVLGDKILDLNHPTLSRMICDINRCNGQINLLEACATYGPIQVEEWKKYAGAFQTRNSPT